MLGCKLAPDGDFNNTLRKAGETVQWLEDLLFIQRISVWVSASTLGGLQPPISPGPGARTPSAGPCEHLYKGGEHTHTYSGHLACM